MKGHQLWRACVSRSQPMPFACAVHKHAAKRLCPSLHIANDGSELASTSRPMATSAAPAAAPAPATTSPHEAPSTSGMRPQHAQRPQSTARRRQCIPRELDSAPLPAHIAVVMDGNARWAARRGLSTFMGHQAGLEAFRETVTACSDWGVQALTVFAFSSENWRRDASEVSFLMSLFSQALRAQGRDLHARGVRLRAIGERHLLPPQLQRDIEEAEALTANNASGLQLTLAISYSGQDDLVAAARSIARQAAQGTLDPELVDRALVERHLSLAPVLQHVGPPDLLIRTSGEMRLSNFLLWELAYAELVFSPVLFPDFREAALVAAVAEFQGRQRRYGARAPSG